MSSSGPRAVANDYARSMIGRDLTGSELLELNAYLGSLSRKRIEQFVRSPVFTAENPAPELGTMPDERPMTEGYATSGSDDVQLYLRDRFAPEERESNYRNLRQAAFDRFGGASPERIAEARRAINPQAAIPNG
jgi:hypothetical protein